ncbi:Hypothetical predicted protein [Cloeon dipterum]|uniref:Uncharacterized protein n=1 Tax=Cloeon dipterum TaxID=197152 RepID=A0A8S1DCH9_9INSE|nr:Hypothetical predicted protein [Cloeon dipterum]
MEFCLLVLSLLIGVPAIFLTWIVVQIAYVHIFSRFIKRPKDFVKAYGPWAVVTGSSDGIGKCYAFELAKRGMNIVLISNEEEKLHAVAEQLNKNHGIETKVINADFTQTEDEHQKIFSVLSKLDIGILVNNVGTAAGLPMSFTEMSREQIWSIMMVNMCAATSMSHLVMPKMKSRSRGMIVNIASIIAIAPAPLGALYAASKAYIRSFSEALEFECRGSGVHVQTVCPSFVKTNIMGNKAFDVPASAIYPLPETFVKNAVATIGNCKFTSGCLSHDILMRALLFLPRSALTWIFYYIALTSARKDRRD